MIDIKTNKEITKEYFLNLGYKIKEGPNWFVVIPKEEEIIEYNFLPKSRPFRSKICILCGSVYKPNNTNQNTCSCCQIFIKCNFCCKYFKKDLVREYIKNCIINNLEIEAFCGKSCANSFKMYKSWNDPEWYEKIGLPMAQKNIAKGQEKLEYLRENDLEWVENVQNQANRQNLEKANEAQKYLLENDKEWKENWLKTLAENGRNNVHFAREALDYLLENDKEWKENYIQILAENGKNNGAINIKGAHKALKIIFKENGEDSKRLRKVRVENGRKNIILLNKNKIDKIKITLENISVIIFNNNINTTEINKLKENDICGSYIIKAKYKGNIGTKNEKNIYNLLACKSKYMYDEIYWVLRVLSQPEKQDKDYYNWTIAKWWYISNLYYDFEFILLTNKNGVSEEEALLIEAKYAIDNEMFIAFDKDRNPIIENKHAYFSL